MISVFNTLAYAQAHFTAYGSELSTNSQKVLYLAEKLTGHYRDWFSSHLIQNPGILQNYDLFVISLISFSLEDKELSTPSTSWFAGLKQGLLPLGKYNRKFLSLQSRLQASEAEACSFYKIGLNILLQEFWALLSLTPPPGTEPKSGGGFCLTAKEVPRRRKNNLCSYCGSKDHLLPACPLSKCSPFVNKTSTLTLLSLNDTSKSPTVLVTIHGPLGKIKVLALLNTGANANFIEEKLAKLLGLPTFGSLDVKVGNSTLIGATPILQPVTIDLESSPFVSHLRESLLNFDHPNNKISFTFNDVVRLLSLYNPVYSFRQEQR
ncbi:Retrotransposon-derived protein peg10 [Entomophthora muscae]|uniref:Retrotransposon-derived protein peg10 n=1 Tax=Entomophthora muscae TaxID=34485 RepID=A0ACC2SAA5_9FUNG|nr:Retrotransposon-derived protein peg10 [Entomophthora muscae]